MKNKLKFLLVAIVAIAMTVTTSCKKESTETPQNNANSDFATHTDDDNQVSAEMDAVANDANDAVRTSLALNGGRIEGNSICEALLSYDTLNGHKTITVTYNGSTCDGKRKRVGTVKISLPAGVQWKNAGAVLTVDVNLMITRKSDGKSIVLKGIATITNVSGGLVEKLSSQGPITHDINSNVISITFDNGTQRSWQIARRRVFTYDNGIVISVDGIHTEGSDTHVAEWGINRKGESFSTSITQPLIVRQDCDFRLGSGQIKHQRDSKQAMVTFGLDKSGNPRNSCPGADHYYLRLEWDNNGTPASLLIAY